MYVHTIKWTERVEIFLYLSPHLTHLFQAILNVHNVYLKAHDGKLLFWMANMTLLNEQIHSCVSNVWSTRPPFHIHCISFLLLLNKDKHVLFFLVLVVLSSFSILVFLDEQPKKNKHTQKWERNGMIRFKIENDSDTKWKIYRTHAHQQQSGLVVSSFAWC